MKAEIKIPALGESITEATISSLIVENGAQVKMDQEIVEIETEKVNQVLFSPGVGKLTLTVNVGDNVKIGQVIGFVDSEASESTSEPKDEKSPQQEQPQEKQEVKEKAKETEAQESEKTKKTPESEEAKKSPEPAKKEAQEPEKAEAQGSVKAEGSVFEQVRKSPEAFVQELKSGSKMEVSKESLEKLPRKAREERKKMSKIRMTIARRLVDAKQSMAMLTTFNEVDMTAILELRKKHKEDFLKQHNVKLGFMSFFIKATVAALKDFPQVNAFIDGNDLVYRHYYDINVAISTERGLVVPILTDCDQKSFAELEQGVSDLATKARDGKLTMDEMRAGGFTISNGGVFGSTFSTPIVNPPQGAILGMHRIVERPYAIDGQIMIRPIMILALSYDHRIIDGREGVSFLSQIVKNIEDPTCLLIDL